MRIISVTVSKRRTLNLGDYNSATMEISLTGETVEGDGEEKIADLEKIIDTEIKRWAKEEGKPVSKRTTNKQPPKETKNKGETKVEKAVEKAEEEPREAEEETDVITDEDLQAVGQRMVQACGTDETRALVRKFTDGKVTSIEGEKARRDFFLKAEEAIANAEAK